MNISLDCLASNVSMIADTHEATLPGFDFGTLKIASEVIRRADKIEAVVYDKSVPDAEKLSKIRTILEND